MLKFKNKKDITLFCCIHPALIMIYADLHWYAKAKHNIDLVITETITDVSTDLRLNRTSSSHREGRALDIRTKNMDVFAMKDIIDYINNKEEFKRYHYLRRSGGYILAYFHYGTNEHIHLALHSDYRAYKRD